MGRNELEALARELLGRNYGPTKHGADPARNWDVTFFSAPHEMRVSELTDLLEKVHTSTVEAVVKLVHELEPTSEYVANGIKERFHLEPRAATPGTDAKGGADG